MANPGPPDVLMAEPWLLTGGTLPAGEFYFDVIGQPQWERPSDARSVLPPGGGPPTLLLGESILTPRRFRVQVRLNRGDNRDTRLAALESAYNAIGPYTLDAPVFPNTCSVTFDPTQGSLSWVATNGARVATIGFQEQA